MAILRREVQTHREIKLARKEFKAIRKEIIKELTGWTLSRALVLGWLFFFGVWLVGNWISDFIRYVLP